MKKWMLISIVISLVLVLTAYGSSQSSNAVATATTGLSQEEKLLVGTLKLESTSQAVSATQAKELLPLWETMQSLASSGTAAQQEVDAVISQIESTMSAEQISSIKAMNLTQRDLAAAMMDTGTSLAASSTASSTNSSSAQSQANVGAPGGGNPPADMGGSIPADMGAQSAGQAQTGTTQVTGSQVTGSTNQSTTALIHTLVALLQKKAA